MEANERGSKDIKYLEREARMILKGGDLEDYFKNWDKMVSSQH